MFKTTTTYTVDPKVRLDKIFKNGLPKDSFINKGRCGIGGTYLELTNEDRCSIIVVPNIPILKGKLRDHPSIDIVYGEISKETVKAWLANPKPAYKIMTTPEGIWKVLWAAAENKRLDEMKEQWFLMLDEAHTFISEYYRKGILLPFKHFWDFHNKCIISATPFFFSDKRFRDLHYHEIKFTKPLGTVHLVNAVSVSGTLNHILLNRNEVPGNLHIFCNSVTEIKNAILRAGLDDCNIYCADDKEGKNMRTLGELSKFYKNEPKTGEYKKVNFYTGKCFEGWDLREDNATLILVTDVHKPHTKIGVASKGKQAIGRLRDEHTPHQILHITNHLHHKTKKGVEDFRQQYVREANLLLEQNEIYIKDCENNNLKPTADSRLVRFADIDSKTQKATFNSNMLDQQINEAANNEIYNHIDYIEKDWKDAYYNVIVEYSGEKLDTATNVKRKSAAKQLEEDYLKILDYKERKANGNILSLGKTPEDFVKDTNPTAYLAAKYLDKATMEALKYNVKKVNAEIICKENELVEVKLLKLLAQEFRIGERYTNEFIKSKLQELYNKLNIRTADGKIRVAKATELGENGRFETKPCKIPMGSKKSENGQQILRAQFGMKMVA